MARPLLPCKLNFTGTVAPALNLFSVGGLATGEKNPENSYGTTPKFHALAVEARMVIWMSLPLTLARLDTHGSGTAPCPVQPGVGPRVTPPSVRKRPIEAGVCA